jgi:phage tail-like protein
MDTNIDRRELMNSDQSVSSYLNYLPAIFQQDPFIGRFLLAFEAVLTGTGETNTPSLAETIGRLSDYFDPITTDEEFLPWLASWVALSLRADWDVDTKKRFIQQIVPLDRLRGTRTGLQTMLELYTLEKVIVFDTFDQPAHFFEVQMILSDADPDRLRQKQQIARAIIDQEKPSHTFYALKISVPTMRLVSLELQQQEDGKPALLMLGKNTLLGSGM